jgi:3-oxoacyl-[acyl-carrier-protein] synthase-3
MGLEITLKSSNMKRPTGHIKQPTSRITAIAGYAPERIVENREIENLVNGNGDWIGSGSIERLFGVKERRFAKCGEQVSDLAVKAAYQILADTDPSTIDCLIFAAASSDLIEPATANIIQSKLGLTCAAFDVKNACNSFVTAMHIANALIVSGNYKKVLLVNGEILSHAIKFNLDNKEELAKRLAAYSLGDAGAAALIEPPDGESGIYSQKMISFGQYWNLCVIPGGGSMHPHDESKTYFEGKTSEMLQVFIENKGRIAEKCLEETGWKLSDVDHFFMHHVSKKTFEIVAAGLGISPDRFFNVIQNHGNIAAASIPFAMSIASKNNILKKGDKIMLIGLASGISISIQLIIW